MEVSLAGCRVLFEWVMSMQDALLIEYLLSKLRQQEEDGLNNALEQQSL